VRRWNGLHLARAPPTVIEVVRVDEPAYQRALWIGTPAWGVRCTRVSDNRRGRGVGVETDVRG
jgi:hypothetical protein